jgi:hypothetical protein
MEEQLSPAESIFAGLTARIDEIKLCEKDLFDLNKDIWKSIATLRKMRKLLYGTIKNLKKVRKDYVKIGQDDDVSLTEEVRKLEEIQNYMVEHFHLGVSKAHLVLFISTLERAIEKSRKALEEISQEKNGLAAKIPVKEEEKEGEKETIEG